jgi:cytochrome P450
MHAMRNDPAIPAWTGDELGSAEPCELEPPYFDQPLNAWVLSRHSDIAAVLQDPRACPANPKSDKPVEPADEARLARLRAETLETLSPTQLRAWQDALAPELDRRLRALPDDAPVDLLAAYATPVCLALAAIVTGISTQTAEALSDAAQRVSERAADPYNDSLRAPAKAAEAALQGHFHAANEIMRDSTFVALSLTLPRLLANAWFALLQFPAQWRLVHRQPELTERAVEETLRYAGLTRILGRAATADLDISGCPIRPGERMVLRLVAANRDPAKFTSPNEVDVLRGAPGHLALGAGPHACVGASLIRMASVALTRPLLQRFGSATLAQPVDWNGGAGFRSPSQLWVRLTP